MKEIKIELTNGKLIPSTITNEELIYGVTAIAIGIKNEYINISSDLGKVEGIFAKHPLTNEKIPIIVLDNDILEKNSLMLVPAHIQEHFELAKKYNLPYKQVVAPYFEGTGEESLNPNAETKFRISVIAVIKNEKDNTYLCVDALKRNCKSFVLGGIEEGETPEEAAIREVKEETGYIDIKINRKSILELHNHFYAAYKGVNRYATLNVIFGILKSKKRERVSEDEFNKQKAVWVKKENLKNFLTVNNNVFVNEYLLDGDCAYEGDGIMINSGKLNGKLRSDVIV
ncbi:MAG: NUDIX domain-containing protein [Lachnospirales bacterium]|jgi:leucine--tRNA ligase